MRSNKLADPTFGLNKQAIAVLALLSGMEPEWAERSSYFDNYQAETWTHTWFNGSERGFALTYWHSDERALIIVCAEQRGEHNGMEEHNGLFLEWWINHIPRGEAVLRNGPERSDRPAAAYHHRLHCRTVNSTAKHIVRILKHFHRTEDAATKKGT